MRAVSVERLSKSYRIAAPQSQLRETLVGQLAAWATDPLRAIARKLRRGGTQHASPEPALHWALRDLSFEVKTGEVVGIIGHNGAGKSTLLKILSRITHPTGGLARVNGRMTSLLEVGTGFHPDLSGRDNVLMNGAILGMTRREIAQRFDAIVEFSGVEEYIDTPIRYYSSGMKVRLAFAVAAHLEPEILVIDEVLAVGDAAFQKRGLQRIEEVGSSGRTILFVSHQLTAVARLCSRTIVLDHGKVVFDGRTLEAIRYYNDSLGGVRMRRDWPPGQQPGDNVARLQSVEVLDGSTPATGPIDVRHRVGVRVRYAVTKGGNPMTPSVHLFDSGGNWIFAAVDVHSAWSNRPRPAGDYETTAWIPPNLLNEGAFIVSVALATVEPLYQHCFVHDCVGFSIFDPMEGDTARGFLHLDFPGVVRPMLDWETQRV